MKNLDKIVDLIIKELFKFDDLNEAKQRVIMSLLENGVKLEDINSAFHFIVKKIHENNKFNNVKKKNRILTNNERSRLSEEAYQYLYNYYYNNIMTWKQMEEVIYNVEKMPCVVDVNDLNQLLEKILFTKNIKNINIDNSIIH